MFKKINKELYIATTMMISSFIGYKLTNYLSYRQTKYKLHQVILMPSYIGSMLAISSFCVLNYDKFLKKN